MSITTIPSNSNDRFFRTINKNTVSAFTTAKTTFESQYPLLDLRDNQLIEFEILLQKRPEDPRFSKEPKALQLVPFREALKQARGLSDTLENLSTGLDKDLAQIGAIKNIDFESLQHKTMVKTDEFVRTIRGKIGFFKACIDALHDQMEKRLNQVLSVLSPQDEELSEGQTWMPESPMIVLPSTSRVPFLTDIRERRSSSQLKKFSLEAQLRDCLASSSSSSHSSSSFSSTMSSPSLSLVLDERYMTDLRRRNDFRSSQLSESSDAALLETVAPSSHSGMQHNPSKTAEDYTTSIEKPIQGLKKVDILSSLRKADPVIQSIEIETDHRDRQQNNDDTSDRVIREDPLAQIPLTQSERMNSKPRTPPKTTPSAPVRNLGTNSELGLGIGDEREMQLVDSGRASSTPVYTEREKGILSGKEQSRRICGGSWGSCTARKQYVQGLDNGVQNLDTSYPRNPNCTDCIIL